MNIEFKKCCIYYNYYYWALRCELFNTVWSIGCGLQKRSDNPARPVRVRANVPGVINNLGGSGRMMADSMREKHERTNLDTKRNIEFQDSGTGQVSNLTIN